MNKKLKDLAIAYEFSLCHGYCPDLEEAQDLWDNTPFEEGSVDISVLEDLQGNSTHEIAQMMVKLILQE